MEKMLVLALALFWPFSAVSQMLTEGSDAWSAVNIDVPENFEESLPFDTARWVALSDYSPNSAVRRTTDPVGRLKLRLANGETGLCSGFLISSDILLTNYHCVPSDGSVVEGIVEFGYFSQLSKPEAFQIDVISIAQDEQLDFAAVRVFGDPGSNWGFVNFADQSPSQGDTLLLGHHPRGLPKKASIVGCFAGPESENLAAGHFFHQCDTLGGSSGSPIFNDSNEVVGIHHTGTFEKGSNAYNSGSLGTSIIPLIRDLITGPTPTTDVVVSINGMTEGCRQYFSENSCEGPFCAYVRTSPNGDQSCDQECRQDMVEKLFSAGVSASSSDLIGTDPSRPFCVGYRRDIGGTLFGAECIAEIFGFEVGSCNADGFAYSVKAN